jgi:hypothetical protein
MGWTLHEVTILVEVHDNAIGYGGGQCDIFKKLTDES